MTHIRITLYDAHGNPMGVPADAFVDLTAFASKVLCVPSEQLVVEGSAYRGWTYRREWPRSPRTSGGDGCD